MRRTRIIWFFTQHPWIGLLLLILPQKRKAETWRGQHHLAQTAHLATRPQRIEQRIRFVDFISDHYFCTSSLSRSQHAYMRLSRDKAAPIARLILQKEHRTNPLLSQHGLIHLVTIILHSIPDVRLQSNPFLSELI